MSTLVQGDGSTWGSAAPLQAGAGGPAARLAGGAGGSWWLPRARDGPRQPRASRRHPSPLCSTPWAPRHPSVPSGDLEYGHRCCQPRLQAASARSCLYGPPGLCTLPPRPRCSRGLLEEGGLVGAQPRVQKSYIDTLFRIADFRVFFQCVR